MKNPRLLILLGLILFIAGGFVAQTTAKAESRKVRWDDVNLTPSNSTLTGSLGALPAKTDIYVNWYTSGIAIQIQHAGTKQPILETYNNVPVITYGVPMAGPHVQRPYLLWRTDTDDNYIVVLGTTDPVTNGYIQFFDANAVPPATTPYLIPGVGVLVLGIVSIFYGAYSSWRAYKEGL